MSNTSNDTSFSGEIRVAARIIDVLSSGLYESPAACLKELINNSYDAGATSVNVYVKPDADRIIIEDDGIGLNRAEFEAHFKRISESHKRDESDKIGVRPKIGKIGIGFVAANEICEVMEIFSTKAGSTELLHVFINFAEMRKPLTERRRDNDEIVKADYEGKVLRAERSEHYTKLFLTSVRGEAKQILASASSQNPKAQARSLYGLEPDSVYKVLKDAKLNTWKDFDFYSETLLHVALNLPIRYYSGWIPAKHHEKVKEFEDHLDILDFSVFYDGCELYKPIVFNPPDNSTLLERFEFKGENISATGYFYAQHGTVKPLELQGLLVRIRNAAVGEYDHTFWGFSQSDAGLIQRWISAEIWADDRLEEAMRVDRGSFRIAYPAYVELRDAIHKQLRVVLNQATTKIYKANRSENITKKVKELAKKKIAPVAPVAARNIEELLESAATKASARRSLQRKFSIIEFYETVLEVGKKVLTPSQLAKFLESLTERVGHEPTKKSRD
jgi:hypothetical protein